MSMSCGSCSIALATVEVVADAVRVEHLDDVDLGGGRDLQDQPGDERAVAGLGVGVAVAARRPRVVARSGALWTARQPLVVEQAGVEHGDLARPCRRRARVVRSGSVFGSLARRTDEPGPPWMRGSPVKRDRGLADEDVVGRDPHRPLRAVGGGLAEPRDRVEDLLRRVLRVLRRAREGGDAERRAGPAAFQPVSTFCDVRRVARPDQDLARAAGGTGSPCRG